MRCMTNDSTIDDDLEKCKVECGIDRNRKALGVPSWQSC